jgi:PAS domain S-box-containing protein
MNYRELVVDNLDRILNFWLMVDGRERIIHCSQQIYRHLGYQESDLIDKPFESLFSTDDPNISDSLYQLLFDSHLGTVVNLKTRIRQKNGIIIEVELSAYQLDNPYEELTLIVFENITEVVEVRKLVKTKIETLYQEFSHFASKDVYRSLRDTIDTILVSVTAGQGLKFNRAFLFLVDEDERLLRGIQAIGPGSGEEAGVIYSEFDFTPKTLTEMIRHYKALINTDSMVNQLVQPIRISLSDYQNILIKALDSQKYVIVNDEYPLVNDPGTQWLRQLLGVSECAVVPLVWHGHSAGVIVVDNQVTRARITNLDIKGLTKFADSAINGLQSYRLLVNLDRSIRQLRQANLKIRESQEMLLQKEKLAVMGELVAHMAHEVRGPLTIIGGYASRIVKKMTATDPYYREMTRIVEAVQTLELVIKDILDGSIPAQETAPRSDCTKAVNKVLGLLEEELHKRKISVSLNIQGDLPAINIREHHLFEIINNLVKNAIEAIGSDGLLLILASNINNKVTITIQDTGPGILPENMEKLFAPFFTTKADGTGLGMVVVKKLVEENQGTIDVSSIPDKGTTFIISFPSEFVRSPL